VLGDTDPLCGPDATLRIGCVAELALQQVQSFVGALYASNPHLETELRHLPSAAQVRALQSGELDLGLLYGTGDLDGIEAVPIFPGERLAAIVPIGHRLARRPVVTPRDLCQEELLTAPRRIDPAVHDALIARVRDAGHEFRRVREWGGGNPRDVLMAVAHGNGVALAPAPLLDAVGELATIVTACPTDPPVRMPATVLSWRAPANPTVSPLLEVARAAARELRGG
jgi:DNA-binding transcriptional LysR family regulator